MRDLSRTVVIISNGNHGGFKHPRQTTLDLYSQLHPAPTVFQTNKYLKGGVGGNVADEFIADPESSGTEGTILISVNPAAENYTVSFGSTSHSFKVKALPISIVIERLLPNPVGEDTLLEEVSLRNKGTQAVSLAGWTLTDRAGGTWNLSGHGAIQVGQSITVTRNGMSMSLNNAGDVIQLLDAAQAERDRFEYTSSVEGVSIPTGH
jgi:Lamin Tail Domain